MIRRAAVLAAFALAAGALMVPSTPAAAAGCLGFTQVQFDSPGNDDFSNTSLNGEFVKIKNSCSKRKSLKNWTVGDEDRIRFTFPKLRLKPNKTVTVFTGVGNNTKKQFFIQENNYVWNNSSDSAFLRNKGGAVVDRCSYDEGDASPVGC